MMMVCNAFAAVGISQANEVKIGRMMVAHEARHHTPAMPSMFGGPTAVTLKRKSAVLAALRDGPQGLRYLLDGIEESQNAIAATLRNLKADGKVECIKIGSFKKWQLS